MRGKRQGFGAALHSTFCASPESAHDIRDDYGDVRRLLQARKVSSLLVDAFMAVLVRGCPLAARVIILLVLARLTSQQDFAHAAVIVAIAEAGRLLADLGTDTWAIRAVASCGNRVASAEVIGDSLAAKTISSGILMLALFAVKLTALPQFGYLDLLTIALLVMSSQLLGLATSVEQALSSLGRLLPIFAVSYALILGFALLIGVSTATGQLSLLAFAASELAVAGYVLGQIVVASGSRWPRNAIGSSLRLIRTVAPIGALNIVVGLYSRLDIIAVAQVSAAAVAAYSIAYRVFQPFNFASAGLGSAVYARSSASSASLPRATGSLMEKSLTTALAAGCIGAAMLWLFGPVAVKALFPEYPSAASVLRTLAPAVMVTALGATLTGLLMGHGRVTAVLGAAICNLVCVTALLAWRVPIHGELGAAQAILVAETGNVLLQFYLLHALVRADRRPEPKEDGN